MKKLIGQLSVPLKMKEDLEFHGSLAGVEVAPRTTLLVDGYIGGDVVLEELSTLMMVGTFDALNVNNQGTLGVSGDVCTPIELLTGTVLVTVGSTVVVNGRQRMVGPSGDWVQVDSLDLTPTQRHQTLKWSARDHVFTPHHDSTDHADFSWLMWL